MRAGAGVLPHSTSREGGNVQKVGGERVGRQRGPEWKRGGEAPAEGKNGNAGSSCSGRAAAP